MRDFHDTLEELLDGLAGYLSEQSDDRMARAWWTQDAIDAAKEYEGVRRATGGSKRYEVLSQPPNLVVTTFSELPVGSRFSVDGECEYVKTGQSQYRSVSGRKLVSVKSQQSAVDGTYKVIKREEV